MSWDKRCDSCIYYQSDWTNPNNTDHYCKNEWSDNYGYNVEGFEGCEEWGEDEE